MPQLIAQPDSTLPADVQAYAEANELLEHLRLAIGLATELFPPIVGLSVCVEEDPEVEDESALVIDVATRLPAAEARARKAQYTERFVAAIPPNVIGEIRLVLDLH